VGNNNRLRPRPRTTPPPAAPIHAVSLRQSLVQLENANQLFLSAGTTGKIEKITAIGKVLHAMIARLSQLLSFPSRAWERAKKETAK
jgi:hypothetical protein